MPAPFRCRRPDCRSDRCPAYQIFSCVSANQEAHLGRERLARRYEARQVVSHQDTPALSVLSIHSGKVRLTRSTSRGQETVVGLRGPGDLLGVREVLSAIPQQVAVTTLEPSVLCATPREAFLEAVGGCPELALRLLRQIARDYLLTEEQLVARAQLSVTERTATLLISLSERQPRPAGSAAPPDITMSREEMALLIGTTRETLSRTLHRFAASGSLEIEEGSIRVRDARALRGLAEP